MNIYVCLILAALLALVVCVLARWADRDAR
jgi:hypothetical protein